MNRHELVALTLWNVNNKYGLDVYDLYILHVLKVLYIILCCECVKGLTFFLTMLMVIHPSFLVEWLVKVEMKKSPSITTETWFLQPP